MMRMVDMARTPAEKKESIETASCMPDLASVPSYKYGHCISLDAEDMKKLNLSMAVQVGDLLHFTAMAKITSMSMSDSEMGGSDCRIELQIQQMGMPEDESTETPEVSQGRLNRAKRYAGD